MIKHPAKSKDERRHWVEDPVTQELIRRGSERMGAAVRVLIDSALGSSDPKIVRLGVECWSLDATLQMLSGTLKDEEKEDG